MPQLEDCKRELFSMFNSALQQNQESLEISAFRLHRRVFGVGPEWVTFCWAAMHGQYDPDGGDDILHGSLDEPSAEFTIDYRLPTPGITARMFVTG
jgi:hypothetical protein